MNDIDSFGMKGSGSKMPHSHSTPAGVDGGSRTPPATPRKAGKMLAVRVQMLDDSITMFQVQVKRASGSRTLPTLPKNAIFFLLHVFQLFADDAHGERNPSAHNLVIK